LKILEKWSCVMLIDDNEADNFLHEVAIREADCADDIVVFDMAEEALESLEKGAVSPEVVFLDLNMPGMDGWEFLEVYRRLPKDRRKAVVIMMLTASSNPKDRERAVEQYEVTGFSNKPLTKDMCLEIMAKFFPSKCS